MTKVQSQRGERTQKYPMESCTKRAGGHKSAQGREHSEFRGDGSSPSTVGPVLETVLSSPSPAADRLTWGETGRQLHSVPAHGGGAAAPLLQHHRHYLFAVILTEMDSCRPFRRSGWLRKPGGTRNCLQIRFHPTSLSWQ